MFRLESDTQRNAHTFVEVVHSRKVAVGPLEYYGVGKRITRAGPAGRANWVLVVCDESPALDEHFRQREHAHEKRIADRRHRPGRRKGASKKASSRGGWHAKLSHPKKPTTSDDPPPQKKRRLSADAKLTSVL
ncbi:hypothetical protein OH76DRAFT_1397898, partial [Lentinus brumalis]